MGKSSFHNHVSWYNFILCIFVILIHAQNTTLFTDQVLIDGAPVFNQAENFIVSNIATTGVAGFFLCSGYLFYRNYSWKKVLEKYKTRIFSLLLPYILWTLIYYFIHAAVSWIPPLRTVFNEQPITVTWQGVVDAVLNYRYCAFLWFLQFLILFVAAAPLIYLLIMNRYIGIASIVIVFLIAGMGGDLTGTLVIGNVQVSALINWLFIYMVGGYIGVHGNQAVESKKAGWPMLAASLILAVISYYFYTHTPSILWNLVYFLMFSIALWSVVAILPLPNAAEWQKNTFVVYMTHFLIVQGVNVVVSSYLSKSMWPGIFLFFLLPFVSFAAAAVLRKLCGNKGSFIWKGISGNR